MTITTFLNENLAWIVIGGLMIIILSIIFKKKKEPQPDYIRNFRERQIIPNQERFRTSPDRAPYEEPKKSKEFLELERELKQFEQKPLKRVYPDNYEPEQTFAGRRFEPEPYNQIKQKSKEIYEKPIDYKNSDDKFLWIGGTGIKKWIVNLVILLIVVLIITFCILNWAVINDKFRSLTDQNCVSNLTCPNNPPCPVCPSCPANSCPSLSCPNISCGNVTIKLNSS